MKKEIRFKTALRHAFERAGMKFRMNDKRGTWLPRRQWSASRRHS